MYTAHARTHENRNMAICAQAQEEEKNVVLGASKNSKKMYLQMATLSCGKKRCVKRKPCFLCSTALRPMGFPELFLFILNERTGLFCLPCEGVTATATRSEKCREFHYYDFFTPLSVPSSPLHLSQYTPLLCFVCTSEGTLTNYKHYF